jgi:lipoate-protein ligase A
MENPVCFEVPSNYEITVYGKKLIGSAQARRREGVLQHGSLPLYGDLARIAQVLVFDNAADREMAALRLLERATTVEAILGTPLSWEGAADAFTAAFSETLNLELQPSEPTSEEWRKAEELVEEKYANPEWTNRT